MEKMRVLIEQIRAIDERGLFIAYVRAVTRERVAGIPRAIIGMTICFENPNSRTEPRELRRQARDEAIRFLDIA